MDEDREQVERCHLPQLSEGCVSPGDRIAQEEISYELDH